MASKKPSPKKKPAEPAPRPSRKAKPKKLGRPPKTPGELHNARIMVALTERDKRTIERAAEEAGETVSSYVLRVVLLSVHEKP